VPVESVGGSHNLTFTGNLLLILGAITFLSFIFLLIVLRLPPKEIDWSKVYPELSEDYDGRVSSKAPGISATRQLDVMLEKAKIDFRDHEIKRLTELLEEKLKRDISSQTPNEMQPDGLMEEPIKYGTTKAIKPTLSIDDILRSELEEGQIGFQYDEAIKQGKTFRFKADLYKQVQAIHLKYVETVQVSVGTVMKVNLYGKNFDTRIVSSEMQFIESGKPSTWEWDVTPLKSGTQSLEIKVSVIVNLPERGEKQKDYPVLIKKIKVEVDPKIAVKNFIVENWRWAAAIVGVSGLVLTYLKNIGYFGNE
jgi:hypothetical protein